MAPTVAKGSKKRKVDSNVHSSSKQKTENEREALHADIGFEVITLQNIKDRLQALCKEIPPTPESNFVQSDNENTNQTSIMTPASALYAPNAITYNVNRSELRIWATAVQTVLEEFYILVAGVGPATYVWGTDRSGAAEQHLQLLSSEMVRSQEQLLARVTPRLNDVLAPVVALVTDRTVTKKTKDENGEIIETKQNYFRTVPEDPDFLNASYSALARNAALLRQLILANFDKLLQSIQDYLTAQQKDSQHDSRGFVY